MKKGVPARAVMTPTGSSEAPVATLAKESQSIKNIAPTIADVGKRIR